MPEMSALEGAGAVEFALLVTVPYAGAILGHMGADINRPLALNYDA